jgi:hypothetical protein
VTFNHGVEGSSPSALTKKINNLSAQLTIQESSVWALCWQIDCRPPRSRKRRPNLTVAVRCSEGHRGGCCLRLAVFPTADQLRTRSRTFVPESAGPVLIWGGGGRGLGARIGKVVAESRKAAGESGFCGLSCAGRSAPAHGPPAFGRGAGVTPSACSCDCWLDLRFHREGYPPSSGIVPNRERVFRGPPPELF